jgi:hypothetical protein
MSSIGWRNWYFIQTAAANPAARRVKFDDEVMGELLRFVSAHEVGHTLGFPHNMKASSAYPVDSLRSASFTCANGTAPSIMDYARFNYVAQPGDEGVCFMPAVGEYDKYATMWGYRPIDVYRRNLQRGYLERMKWLMTEEPELPSNRFFAAFLTPVNVTMSDIRPLVRGELQTLEGQIGRALSRARGRTTRLHLQDALERIDATLSPDD